MSSDLLAYRPGVDVVEPPAALRTEPPTSGLSALDRLPKVNAMGGRHVQSAAPASSHFAVDIPSSSADTGILAPPTAVGDDDPFSWVDKRQEREQKEMESIL